MAKFYFETRTAMRQCKAGKAHDNGPESHSKRWQRIINTNVPDNLTGSHKAIQDVLNNRAKRKAALAQVHG